MDLRIYDVSGRLVRTLRSGSLKRGYHDVSWNGADQYGRPVTSGIYFSLLQVGPKKLTRKIVVVR